MPMYGLQMELNREMVVQSLRSSPLQHISGWCQSNGCSFRGPRFDSQYPTREGVAVLS